MPDLAPLPGPRQIIDGIRRSSPNFFRHSTLADVAVGRSISTTSYDSHRGSPHMADFTKDWIEHLKSQITGRLSVVADKMDPQTYDELVTDLAWFTFRFAKDPDTKMRKVFR